MAAASQLRAIFDSLPASPKSDTFTAAPLGKNSPLRIGRSPRGTPVLMVRLPDSEKSFAPGLRMSNLATDYAVPCTIKLNGTSEKGVFAIVEYIGSDRALRDYFFAISASLIQELPGKPTSKSVRSILGRYVDLFSLLTQTPKNSVQGLWAELLLIYHSKNIRKLVEGWHRDPYERYDFSLSQSRVEVKSYSGQIRQHHFSLEQLRHNPDLDVLVCSINVQPSAGGTSIRALRDRINAALSGLPDLSFHVDQQIGAALGSGMPQALDVCFDTQTATHSIAWYDSAEIPAISTPPKFVSNVHFVSDLTSAKQCSRPRAARNALRRFCA